MDRDTNRICTGKDRSLVTQGASAHKQVCRHTHTHTHFNIMLHTYTPISAINAALFMYEFIKINPHKTHVYTLTCFLIPTKISSRHNTYSKHTEIKP